jgi:hypothetical protein
LRDNRFDFSAFWARVEDRARETGSVIYSRQTRLNEYVAGKKATKADTGDDADPELSRISGGNTEVLTTVERVATALKSPLAKNGAKQTIQAEQLLECYVDSLDLVSSVAVEARVLHYKDKKGQTTSATYSKSVPLQQDNSGAEGRKWQAWLDSKAVIRSEDLVLQLVSVRHRVEGEALRLQAWHNLQRLRLLMGEGRHHSAGVGT